MANEDPFEDVLNLEEQFYQEGYKQGQDDGVRAGLIEGRSLGLEKGFQKFFESGRLYGRAVVWANRLPTAQKPGEPQTDRAEEYRAGTLEPTPDKSGQQHQLPPLPRNARLEKHITTLYALVESESLSTDNTDEAVNDFDDRLKRAHGKAKIIEGLVGEKHHKNTTEGPESPGPSKMKLEL